MTLKRIYVALLNYEQMTGSGIAFAHAPYVLTDSSDWIIDVRFPDIMVFRAERLATYRVETPDFENKPFILVPDLCVEIATVTEKYLDVVEKVDKYLSDGVKLIWVVNPRTKTVAVYMQGSDQITRLTSDATLTGGDLLPEFSLLVKDIFPE